PFNFVGPILSHRLFLLPPSYLLCLLLHSSVFIPYRIGVIRDDIGHQLINRLGVNDSQLHISEPTRRSGGSS
ncbi:hypothetical protein, partial [Pseudomonas peli]|uniref:hypothetical protein n=1 Tax=Pseudomonas peli TaxID=592361 RepID=UPI003D314A6D